MIKYKNKNIVNFFKKNMKKKMSIVFLAGTFLFFGCGNKPADNNANVSNDEAKINQEEKKENKDDIITSIKDAMGMGEAMKCVYKVSDNEGDMEVVTYVEGEKYKTEMMVAGMKQYSIFDGETMYSWGDKQPQGTKMTKSCLEKMGKNAPQDSPENSDEKISGEETFQNAMDVKCKKASSVDFSAPENISFVDQCEMMNNALKNIPQGMNIPQNIPQMP